MDYAGQRNNTIIAYLSFSILFVYMLLLVECKSKDLLVSVSLVVGTTVVWRCLNSNALGTLRPQDASAPICTRHFGITIQYTDVIRSVCGRLTQR